MAATERQVVSTALVIAAMGWTSAARADERRIRTDDAVILHAIEDATERSATFRRLVSTIDTSDGLVFISSGKCPGGVRACLVWQVTKAGPYRVLRVFIDKRKMDVDLMVSLGHELQHVVEVLENPRIIRTADLFAFYTQIALDPPTSWLQTRRRGGFETARAIEASKAVREELEHGR